MKKAILLTTMILGVSMSLIAQIEGNRKITTKSFSIEGANQIVCSIYADITIDAQGDDVMTITTDENLIDLIDTEVVDGRLTLRQKEWIRESENIKIEIGVKDLEQVIEEVHEKVVVNNLDQDHLSVMAILGQVDLRGRLESLNAGAESGDIIATRLEVDNIRKNIWGDGKLYTEKDDTYDFEEKSREHTVANVSSKDLVNPNAQYIDIKLRNNSLNKISAFVRGPKPEGGYFSYGFNMFPGQTRKERWTVGTKVFKVSKLGMKKKLLKLSKEDKNSIVKMF